MHIRRNLGVFVVLSAAYVILAGRMFRIIDRYAVNLLWWDAWDFDNATLFERHSLWQIFTWQHGAHRQGVGAILAKYLEPLFHWNTRIEDFAIGGIILAAATCALFLKTRLYGSPTYYDVVIPLLFFTPTQIETFMGNPSYGALPLFLIMLYCVAWTINNQYLRYAVVIFLNFLLIFTGFGLFMGFLTPLLLGISYLKSTRDSRARFVHTAFVALALASLALFFVGYQPTASAACFNNPVHHYTDYLWFFVLMYAKFLGKSGHGVTATILGAFVVALSAFALVQQTRATLRSGEKELPLNNVLPALLVSYCFIFCAAVAFGRICFGIDAAQANRYMTYLILGLLGLYFSALCIQQPRKRQGALALLALLALFTGIPVHSAERRTLRWYHDGKSSWRSCYLSQKDIAACDHQTNFWVYPSAEATHLKEKLDYLERNKLNLFADGTP